MKVKLLSLLAIVVLVGLILPKVGTTVATWSDSETSRGNYIETGSLDLKVDGMDDKPWGVGVGTFFDIPDGVINTSYTRTVSLWNAGTADGVAYLHIKNVAGCLADNVYVDIEFAGNPVISNQRIDLLDCHEILLGDLPACTPGDLKMVMYATGGASGEKLEFDIEFDLVGSWADSEQSSSHLTLKADVGGTPGFWKGPGAVKQYGKPALASWFRTIVLASDWFEDGLAMDGDEHVYNNMVAILADTGAGEYTGMVNQFRAQYLATRLNTMPDPPRLQPGVSHDISSIDGAEAYFGYGSGTVGEIIFTIESKATDGEIFLAPPDRGEAEIMKDVCDRLNNP